LLIGCLASVAVVAMEDLKPYPEAANGLTRHVIRLPEVSDESNRKVEIRAGKNLMVDCNRTHFTGNLERRIAKGWGYPYYELGKAGGPVSTMMACPEGAPKTEQFVPVVGDGYLLRYNSKLPVVVFVPEGFAVQYRLWTTTDQFEVAGTE
jgi:ecotin